MLAVVQVQALKPAARPFKVFDSAGLYLLVQPSGALLWRFRYRCCGIERKLSLGSFPQVTLSQARRKREGPHGATS
ncbi:Arm DNA-binding domain-containing protein [Sphingomonas sp. S2-65]|uniref:Arm DNA-binding domain-containing protein n=1 Tax=Sphingomonas sp. S2-65 TaxID=2903960 RepID=UPI001F24FC89|nr:Arm DNA-binding domain-containing protein [Sphingomonas sp. S2-65]UYY58144.1 Arm DNA-binding domain-containing protein [Sphingomonas sp. S2-65]